MLVAIAGSLAVHGLLARETYRLPLKALGWNLDVPAGPAASAPRPVTVVLIDPRTGAPPEPLPLAKPDEAAQPPAPAPEPPKPPEPEPPKPDAVRLPDRIGESTGTGIGTHRAEGRDPIKAREAENDQAFLSRDPRGPGMVGVDPSKSAARPGEGGTGGIPGPLAGARAETNRPTPTGGASAPRPADPTPPLAALAPRVEPSRRPEESPPAVARRPAPLPLPITTPPPPQAGPAVDLGPLVLLPPPRQPQNLLSPPVRAPDRQPGQGQRGVRPDVPLPPADSGLFPAPADRPTPTPGRTDPPVPTVAIPRIAPPTPQPAATPPETRRPPVAIALVPPAPPPAPPVPEPTRVEPSPDAVTKPPTPPAPVPPGPTAVASVDEGLPVPPAAPAQAALAGTGDGRKIGAPTPPADPAQESDSETDAFARIGSAEFRDGRLDVQFGRKVKTVRPRIPIVGQVDAFTLRNPRVVLKVQIDATGKVTQAAVHKSSGSNEIDQPCLVAMYEWWFEPLKDKQGRPRPDSFLFTISFR